MNALETRVLEMIGEDPDSPDVFTSSNTQIRDSINDAIAEIVMITGGHKKQYFIPLRQDTSFYRLLPENGSVGWITDVFLVDTKYRLRQTDLIQLSATDPRWMLTTAPPERYIPIGQDVIGFYPRPPSNSNVIEINMVLIPSAYTNDGDKIKIRDSYEYAAVNYAVSEFWASRGDSPEAQKYMGYYMEALGLSDTHFTQNEKQWTNRTQKE